MNFTSVLEEVACAACVMLSVWFYSLALGPIVFSPLHRSRFDWRQRLPSLRFHLVDLLVLLIQIQLILAISFGFNRNSHIWTGSLVFLVFALVLVMAWWWKGIQMLSRAEIQSTKHRLWFLGLLVPIGYTVAFLAPIVFFASVYAFIVLIFASVTEPLPESAKAWLSFSLVVIVAIPVVATAIYLCRIECEKLARVGRVERRERAAQRAAAEVVAEDVSDRHNGDA